MWKLIGVCWKPEVAFQMYCSNISCNQLRIHWSPNVMDQRYSTPLIYKKVLKPPVLSREERIGPDRPVGPVQPGIGPQASPVSTTKSVVVQTGQKQGKTSESDRSNWLTSFFLKKKFGKKMLLFLLLKKKKKAQLKQKFIFFEPWFF